MFLSNCFLLLHRPYALTCWPSLSCLCQYTLRWFTEQFKNRLKLIKLERTNGWTSVNWQFWSVLTILILLVLHHLHNGWVKRWIGLTQPQRLPLACILRYWSWHCMSSFILPFFTTYGQWHFISMAYSLSLCCLKEADAALGNGGLARLSACQMDSLATMDFPAWG